MPRLLVNIDVPDTDEGIAFYTAALGLAVGRRFDNDFVELIGAPVPIYLLRKDAGSSIGPDGGGHRHYERHWSPVHFDVVVSDMTVAVAQAIAAGAVQEGDTLQEPYGKLAMFADPFGHAFCLIEFNDRGYDALLGA